MATFCTHFLLVVFIFFLSVSCSDDFTTEIPEPDYEADCKEKYNMTSSTIEDLLAIENPSRDEMCLTKCLMQLYGHINEFGNVNMTEVKEQYSEQINETEEAVKELHALLDKCYSKRPTPESDAEDCKSSYEFSKCAYFAWIKVVDKEFNGDYKKAEHTPPLDIVPKTREECHKKYHVDSDSTDYRRRRKCSFFCLLTAGKIIDENGNINMTELVEVVCDTECKVKDKKSEIEQGLNECYSNRKNVKDGGDECDGAGELETCMIKAIHEVVKMEKQGK